MDQEQKEDMFKWILRELESSKLVTSRLIHQVSLSKSDYDSQKREAFVIKDTVSTKKRDAVEMFLSNCRHQLRDRVDESNIQIELNCGYTKGDDFIGFHAHKQLIDGHFEESLTKVECLNVNGKGQVTVIDFLKYGQYVPLDQNKLRESVSSGLMSAKGFQYHETNVRFVQVYVK